MRVRPPRAQSLPSPFARAFFRAAAPRRTAQSCRVRRPQGSPRSGSKACPVKIRTAPPTPVRLTGLARRWQRNDVQKPSNDSSAKIFAVVLHQSGSGALVVQQKHLAGEPLRIETITYREGAQPRDDD